MLSCFIHIYTYYTQKSWEFTWGYKNIYIYIVNPYIFSFIRTHTCLPLCKFALPSTLGRAVCLEIERNRNNNGEAHRRRSRRRCRRQAKALQASEKSNSEKNQLQKRQHKNYFKLELETTHVLQFSLFVWNANWSVRKINKRLVAKTKAKNGKNQKERKKWEKLKHHRQHCGTAEGEREGEGVEGRQAGNGSTKITTTITRLRWRLD